MDPQFYKAMFFTAIGVMVLLLLIVMVAIAMMTRAKSASVTNDDVQLDLTDSALDEEIEVEYTIAELEAAVRSIEALVEAGRELPEMVYEEYIEVTRELARLRMYRLRIHEVQEV